MDFVKKAPQSDENSGVVRSLWYDPHILSILKWHDLPQAQARLQLADEVGGKSAQL